MPTVRKQTNKSYIMNACDNISVKC